MGDIAEMMLEGILDEQTGEYIDDEISMSGGCGYPRTSNRYRNPKRKGKNALLGLKKFTKLDYPEFDKIIEDYSVNILGHKQTHLNAMCVNVQKDFNSFAKWFNDKNKTK